MCEAFGWLRQQMLNHSSIEDKKSEVLQSQSRKSLFFWNRIQKFIYGARLEKITSRGFAKAGFAAWLGDIMAIWFQRARLREERSTSSFAWVLAVSIDLRRSYATEKPFV